MHEEKEDPEDDHRVIHYVVTVGIVTVIILQNTVKRPNRRVNLLELTEYTKGTFDGTLDT